MAKYFKLQTRKLISRYGGVGSIVETIQGAMLIKPFDKWRFFRQLERGRIDLTDENKITDDRLFHRLKIFFPELKEIIKVPDNYPNFNNPSMPIDRNATMNAEYFPKWFYCNKCGRFKHLDDWWKGWQEVYNGNQSQQLDSFTPPVCYKCYLDAINNNENRRFYPLEQVRFILTSPEGEIKDVPWEFWTNLKRYEEDAEQKDDSEGGQKEIIFNGKCCDNQDLRYIKSYKISGLSGISIKCVNPECKTKGKPVTLSGFFNLRTNCKEIKDKEGGKIKSCFKPAIRTSNSVYYPIITNSLFLPHKENLSKEDKVTAYNLFHNKNKSIKQIAELLDVPIVELKNYLNPPEFITENEYRLKEYKYLTTEDISDDENLIFEKVEANLGTYGINRLLRIKRLKLTSVQTGYTRQEPIDKDLFAEYSMEDYIPIGNYLIKTKYTSIKGSRTKYLPGIESFGEGIFIGFNHQQFDNWFEQYLANESLSNRLNKLVDNANNSGLFLTGEKEKMLNNKMYLSKFLILHTLSHILIKEFEFLVGYPATSLNERLYVDDQEMQGILIYTIAGTEGSFGGLISQAEPHKFINILRSALERAKDCASDPICYHSDGQGIAGLNLAACYSCSLLPETSCEEYNSFLDRAILIDNEYGFFNKS